MPKPDRLARDLVAASMELHRRRSWNHTVPDAPVLLRVPVEEEPLAGVLIGQGGSEFGLMLLPGPDALAHLHRAFMSDDSGDSRLEQVHLLSVSFERLGEIDGQFRRPLQAAGFQTRRKDIAPLLIARPPDKQPRPPSRHEMKIALWCLRAIFAAEDRGELRPRPLAPGRRVLELAADGALRAPRVKASFVPWSETAALDSATPVLLPADLRALPRTQQRWLATTPALPGRVVDDDRTWRALLLFDQSSEQLICNEVVPSGEAGSLQPPLAKALREHGLPRGITCSDELLQSLVAPGLKALGIEVDVDADLPLFEELRYAWNANREALVASHVASEAPETLEEWKEAERNYCHGQADTLMERDLITPRALKRYFGSRDTADEVLEQLTELSPLPALVEWLAADYRPTSRSKTYLEKELVKRRLDPVNRALMEARRDALLSIFRVDSVQLGASFEVEDILAGGRYTVQDRSLSACGIEGLFLPLRLIRVQEWIFPLIAGPLLHPFTIDRMLGSFDSAGFALETEDLRDRAHLFGQLWRLFLEARDDPPQLQNTDGDPLELLRARYRVADPGALRKALAHSPDIFEDEPGSAWTWSREGGPGIGDRTTLARLELIGDELLVEVNSTRRLKRSRQWLDRLPGLTFEGASSLDFDDTPLDDRLPGPPPEPLPDEVRAQIAHLLAEQARQWLDKSIPALGGLTPRAACATERGRRQVARLIRTMPPIQIPGGEIPPPREELLRELGLGRG